MSSGKYLISLEHLEIETKFGRFSPIETADGSITYQSSFFNEACHSLDGAYSETLYQYIEGCEIVAQAQRRPSLTILEIGLGAGLGVDCTWDHIQHFKIPISIISTEIDTEIIDYNIALRKDHPLWNSLRPIAQGYYGEFSNISLLILKGDATESLVDAFEKNLFSPVHAIYQDAFSPGRNPDLWTYEWFSTLHRLAGRDAVMTTYSSSEKAIQAMAHAGWHPTHRKGFGRKKHATKATCNES